MSSGAELRPAIRDLARYLTGGDDSDAFTRELATWLSETPRFRAFATAHRDKIRKKLRGATDEGARRDVRAELRVARLLLAERQIDLEFEAYGSGKGGPDFTVTFRGGAKFDLEVTRIRGAADSAAVGGTLLAKLRQLRAGTPNALVIVIDGPSAATVDVAAVTATLRRRADRKDEAFFSGRGFEGTRDFYRRFLRLGVVFVLAEGAAGKDRATAWRNPSARIALPEVAARTCVASLLAGSPP